MEVSIAQRLAQTATQHPRTLAIAAVDRQLTYAELDGLVSQAAIYLQSLGTCRGDRVVLWLENGWRWVVAYHAILRLGAVAVPANSLLTAAEVDFMLADCAAGMVIAPARRLAQLTQANHMTTIAAGGPDHCDRSLDAFLAANRDQPCTWTAPHVAGHALAAICYTSGTTGYPKGAMLRHESLILSARLTGLMHGKTEHDVIISALPFCHVYGSIVLNSAIAVGASVIILPRFDESLLLESIERYGATIVEATPASYLALLNARELDSAQLATLRLCTVGGQGMPETSMRAVESRLRCRLIELWGMTEVAGPGITHPYNAPSAHGSIGIPLPLFEVKVVDPNDSEHEMPDLEVGELLVRGPQVMSGYLDRPEATSKLFTHDRWMHTGDLVQRDTHGNLYLVDRIKDVILSGGYTIYPAEVERVLAAYPAVMAAAVVPQEDPLRGQIGKAYVRLRAGMQCDREDLITHCRKYLARFKVPRVIEFIDELPCTSTGKVLRRALIGSTGSIGWRSPMSVRADH